MSTPQRVIQAQAARTPSNRCRPRGSNYGYVYGKPIEATHPGALHGPVRTLSAEEIAEYQRELAARPPKQTRSGLR